MKLCIPSMGQNGIDDAVGQHFGKVPYYTLYDTESKEVSVISNTSEHNGGTGLPPEIMAKESVDIMLCGGLGRKAVVMFEQYGIDVFIGATGSIRMLSVHGKETVFQRLHRITHAQGTVTTMTTMVTAINFRDVA
ncbi:MAG: NifB/NifX family molybdenum-iron cluster-binding protein [Methanolobus sp.]